MQVSSDIFVDEEIICLDSDMQLENALLAITDNPLFLNIKAQDNVGIGNLVWTASDDHSSLTTTRRSSTSLPRVELTKKLMKFGALIHGLMAELFPRKHGRPLKSIYLQQQDLPVVPTHAMITRSSGSLSFSNHD